MHGIRVSALGWLMGAITWALGAPPTLVMTSFDPSAIPAGLAFKGTVVDGARWKDKNGDNLLLLTQTGRIPTPGWAQTCPGCDPAYDQEVRAYHFVKTGPGYALLWQTQDYERECSYDLQVAHLKNSLYITDLDADGIAETTFAYVLICRSDVSPGRMKLLMHEGKTKYALRGTTMLHFRWEDEEPVYDGGQMEIDPAFKKADARFLVFAKQTWQQLVQEEHMKPWNVRP